MQLEHDPAVRGYTSAEKPRAQYSLGRKIVLSVNQTVMPSPAKSAYRMFFVCTTLSLPSSLLCCVAEASPHREVRLAAERRLVERQQRELRPHFRAAHCDCAATLRYVHSVE